jgi:hypothetical protein
MKLELEWKEEMLSAGFETTIRHFFNLHSSEPGSTKYPVGNTPDSIDPFDFSSVS